MFRWIYICYSEKGLVNHKILAFIHWLYAIVFIIVKHHVILIKIFLPHKDPEKMYPNNMVFGLVCLQEQSVVTGRADFK